MISHENRCIYIHIPKTAGTSIEKRLGAHIDCSQRLSQDHRTIRNIQSAISPSYGKRIDMRSVLSFIYQRYQAHKHGVKTVTKDQFTEYFKFCFVRNPWDRAYSWYRNVLRDTIHQTNLGIEKNISFSDFLINHADQWALMPQTDWIIDNKGNVVVDFVGKFENLESDFKLICERLYIEDATLPVTLDSGNVSYIDAYDNKLIKLIEVRYHTEILLFDYKFGE